MANPSGFDTDTTNKGGNTSYATYGQGTYHFTDKLGLVLGVRESHERKEDTLTVFANKFDAFLLPATPLEHSWNSFTYRAGLQYQMSPEVLAYTSISTGFKSGGFNGRAQSTVFIAFNPERATTYEAGLKSELLDRRLRLNAAAYITNYNDIQTTLNVNDPVTGVVTNVVANPADARIKGLELDSSFLITDYLTLRPRRDANERPLHKYSQRRSGVAFGPSPADTFVDRPCGIAAGASGGDAICARRHVYRAHR